MKMIRGHLMPRLRRQLPKKWFQSRRLSQQRSQLSQQPKKQALKGVRAHLQVQVQTQALKWTKKRQRLLQLPVSVKKSTINLFLRKSHPLNQRPKRKSKKKLMRKPENSRRQMTERKWRTKKP
jgi:hypothetical protein